MNQLCKKCESVGSWVLLFAQNNPLLKIENKKRHRKKKVNRVILNEKLGLKISSRVTQICIISERTLDFIIAILKKVGFR